MKQTNNAIKFLMAQYRAIFKNAYFKGLTSAVLLTAGLTVAGGAQADSYYTVSGINGATGDTITADYNDGDSFVLAVPEDSTISKDIEIVFKDSNSSANITNSGATAASGATVTLDASKQSLTISNRNNKDGQEGIFSFAAQNNRKLAVKFDTLNFEDNVIINVSSDSGDSGSGVDVQANTINIGGATVNINQQSATENSNNAILRAGTINVMSDSVVNVGNTALASSNLSGSRAVLGWRAEQDGTDGAITNGSNISFAADSTLNLNSYQSGGKSTTGQVWGNSLTMTGAFLNVKGSDDSILNVHTTNLNDTQVVIDQGAKLIITPLEVAQKNGTSYTDYYKNINGTMNVNGGTMVVNGAITLNRGGSLTIGDDVQLTATAKTTQDTAAGADSGAIVIGFAKDAVTNETLAGTTNPTLNISSKTLKDFVTATENLKYTLTDADGTENEVTDGAGKLVLSDGARVNFTDTDTVEISDFKFGQTSTSGAANIWADLNYGDKLGANTGTDSLGEDKEQLDGNIRMFASNMSIAKSLLSDPQNNDNSSEDIYFDANSLIVGSEKSADGKWAGFDSTTSRIGVKGLKAKDDITFIDGKGDTFYLQDTVELNRDYYVKDNGVNTEEVNTAGLIKGDDLVLGSKDGSTNAGNLNVNGGAWRNDGNQALEITYGRLAVNAAEGTLNKDGITYDGANNRHYYTNGNPTSLTWNGSLHINGSSYDKASIAVTGAHGANASLDLRNASITWGNGYVTLSGDDFDTSKTDPEASAGEGILYITGNQFKSFLGNGNVDADGNAEKTATKLNLENSGVLYVDGAVTGDVVFEAFTSAAEHSGDAGVVNFVTGYQGTLVTTGGLSLVTGEDDSNGDPTAADDLNIGSGTIQAQTISISNLNVDPDDVNDRDANSVTVGSGTLEVTDGFTSQNLTVNFNTGSGLVLEDDIDHTGGVVSTNLVFNGDATLDVEDGTWSLAEGKDITLTGGANFNVGTENYDILGVKAALTADNLEVTDGGNNTIYGGSSATFNTLQAGTATFNIGGQLTINGREVDSIDTSRTSTELDAVQDNAETAGINLAGATFNVEGSNAKLELGAVATSTLVSVGTETTGSGDTATTTTKVTVNDVLGDAEINLKDHGVLRLNFADNVLINAEAARQLKAQLLDSNQKGLLEVGLADLDIKYDDKTNLITSWDNVKDFVNLRCYSDQLLRPNPITD